VGRLLDSGIDKGLQDVAARFGGGTKVAWALHPPHLECTTEIQTELADWW
jgi:hypothetical protein